MTKSNTTVGEVCGRDAAEKICDSMFVAKEEAIMIVMSLSMPRLAWGMSDLLPVNNTQASTSIIELAPATNTHTDTARLLCGGCRLSAWTSGSAYHCVTKVNDKQEGPNVIIPFVLFFIPTSLTLALHE
jgi:hypothetical protein